MSHVRELSKESVKATHGDHAYSNTSIGDLLSNPFQRQEEMPYIHQRCNVNVALFEGGGTQYMAAHHEGL